MVCCRKAPRTAIQWQQQRLLLMQRPASATHCNTIRGMGMAKRATSNLQFFQILASRKCHRAILLSAVMTVMLNCSQTLERTQVKRLELLNSYHKCRCRPDQRCRQQKKLLAAFSKRQSCVETWTTGHHWTESRMSARHLGAGHYHNCQQKPLQRGSKTRTTKTMKVPCEWSLRPSHSVARTQGMLQRLL